MSRDDFKDTFMVTISSGEEWIDLHNGFDRKLSPEGFGMSNMSYRKETATSRYYDGTYVLHKTKDNVVESMSIYLYGESQNEVTENIMLLQELFEQPQYQIRVQMGDHRETWYCQPVDSFQVDRSHVFLHNTMAKVTVQIPRLPDTTKEIVL